MLIRSRGVAVVALYTIISIETGILREVLSCQNEFRATSDTCFSKKVLQCAFNHLGTAVYSAGNLGIPETFADPAEHLPLQFCEVVRPSRWHDLPRTTPIRV